jgi:uncharacterized protein (TIGR02001 family)
MFKKTLILLPVLAVIAAGAQAQTAPAAPAAAASAPEPAPSPLSANINLTTKYKFRGQDQGNTNWISPALQGGFDWAQNGWYLGNWNSNVNFTNASIEMDFYGGYKGEIVKDVGYDVGILQYYYPQKNKAFDYNVTELYGAASYDWLSLKTSWTVSKDYFGIGEGFKKGVPLTSQPKGRNTLYFDLSGNYPLVDKLTLNAHVGYTRYASDLRNVKDGAGANIGVPSFYDYKLGVTYDLGSGYSVAGAVVGASKRTFYKNFFGADVNQTRAIFTISKTM